MCLSSSVGIDQVLLQVGIQPEHPLGDRGRPEPGDELERTGGRLDHPGGEAVPGGAGEHGGVGLEAQTQPVLGDQPGGERVVGHDQLFTRLVHPGLGDDPGPEQGVPDPRGQLGGRLAGEGQPQHLLGPDRPGADQPDHPGRHHGGLAGPGSGDDHPGFQRGGDRGQLRVGERDAERVDQIAGGSQPRRSASPGPGSARSSHHLPSGRLGRAAAGERAVAAAGSHPGLVPLGPNRCLPPRPAAGAPRWPAVPPPGVAAGSGATQRERHVVQRRLGEDLADSCPVRRTAGGRPARPRPDGRRRPASSANAPC